MGPLTPHEDALRNPWRVPKELYAVLLLPTSPTLLPGLRSPLSPAPDPRAFPSAPPAPGPAAGLSQPRRSLGPRTNPRAQLRRGRGVPRDGPQGAGLRGATVPLRAAAARFPWTGTSPCPAAPAAPRLVPRSLRFPVATHSPALPATGGGGGGRCIVCRSLSLWKVNLKEATAAADREQRRPKRLLLARPRGPRHSCSQTFA